MSVCESRNVLRTQHEGIMEAAEVDHGVKYLLQELEDPNSNRRIHVNLEHGSTHP